MSVDTDQAALVAALDEHAALAIAVSGGVDSMLLAYVAHRFSRVEMTAVHAASPAVPIAATARVREHAARHGWNLRIIDAGELNDPSYRSNPVDRCFYCKTNLYTRIRAVTGLSIASGANLDDLDDYRPGLLAARNHDVVHPFIAAKIGKAAIYAMAAACGLSDLAALPAQPCLSSRIETGIAVGADALQFIEETELAFAAMLPGAQSIRARITATGVQLECADLPAGAERLRIERWAAEHCAAHGRAFAGLRQYRRGAAFLRNAAE